MQPPFPAFDIEDLHRFVPAATRDALRVRGQTLDREKFDDLIQDMWIVALETVGRYDPERNTSCSKWLHWIIGKRVVDWNRRFYDADYRYGQQHAFSLSEQDRDEVAAQLDLSLPEILDLIRSGTLTPASEWTAEQILMPVALGAVPSLSVSKQVFMDRTGANRREVNRMIKDLGRELRLVAA